ncbi:MAG: MarR family transcriptional regulator [Anaerolineales bacterium]|nr:MarR family transcriptional regulator [Anaerolineales bacterium]
MPISQAELEALAAFRYTLRQFLAFSDQAARAVGLTPRQHQALLSLQGIPGRHALTISEFAERLQIRPHSAVGLVNRLVALRLLRRVAGRADRRQVFVRLTPAGARLLESLSEAHRAELRRLGPQLLRLFSDLGL